MKKQLLLAVFTIFVGIGITKAQLFTNDKVNVNITSNVYVNIQGGGLLNVTGGSTISNLGSIILTGDFVNNDSFNSGANSYVKLTGAAQDVGGTSITTFNNLVIDGTANKTISKQTNVADSLKFIANYVLIGTNNLVLLSGAPGGIVSGAAATKYVVTNSTGSLIKKSVPATADFLFPVGNVVANYEPVILNNTGTVDTFAVRVEAGVNPTTGADPECVQLTYYVLESNSGGSNASLDLGWNSASPNDEGGSFVRANAYMWQNDGTWNLIPGTMGALGGGSVWHYKTSGITDFSSTADRFIVRTHQILSTTNPNPVSSCAVSSTTFSVTATGSNVNYQWQVNCGGGWSDITAAGSNPTYANWTTDTLHVNSFVPANNGCQYRCMVYDLIDTIYSNPATLTVFPYANANAGSDTTIVIGQSVQLDGSGGTSYSWTPASGLTDPNSPNPIASPTTTTTYVLQVTDGNGCIDFDTVTVFVNDNCGDVFVPNAFSPNGDLVNDIEYVHGNCLKDLDFVIYDRWGEKVFESTDLSKGWDGKFKGELMNPGVFVYYLTGTTFKGDAVKMQGNITLFK